MKTPTPPLGLIPGKSTRPVTILVVMNNLKIMSHQNMSKKRIKENFPNTLKTEN